MNHNQEYLKSCIKLVMYKYTGKINKNKLLHDKEDEQIQKHREVLKRLRTSIIANGKINENTKKMRTCTSEEKEIYKKFMGFWLLTTTNTFSDATLFEFTLDEFNLPILITYVGTQKNLRVPTEDDLVHSNLFTYGLPMEVVIINEHSVIIKYFGDILGLDDLTNTFTIQDNNPKQAINLYFLDNSQIGMASNNGYHMYKKLDKSPFIQQVNKPAVYQWNNPVNLFNYINDYFFLQGNPQKDPIFNQKNFIGLIAAKKLFHQFLTIGSTHRATCSTRMRGSDYIGIWRTQFPDIFPITTIHTNEANRFNLASTIHISGLIGSYAILNGIHKAATFPPSTISKSVGMPWELDESREHFVNIQYDSSHITESYNPQIHGIAKLEAHHIPITCNMKSYRDFIATIIDYIISVFGEATYNRLKIYLRSSDLMIPETFNELACLTANDQTFLFTVRFRTLVENTNMSFYKNPYITNNGINSPPTHINDPYGLGLLIYDKYFDYDIPIKNYLEIDTIHNVFWTVTGPILPEQPITELLMDYGYPSNGSEFVFKANTFQQVPSPLVDKYGSHPYRYYGTVVADSTNDIIASHLNYVGGIVKRSLTNEKIIAYIRLSNTLGFDYPNLFSNVFPLTFGRNDMPDNKLISNEIAAIASLLEPLNKYNPDKYIFDFRNNSGGFTTTVEAIPFLFGANRPGWHSNMIIVNDSQIEPILGTNTKLDDAFGGLLSNNNTEALINTNLIASIFPQSIVRGTSNRPIELIILNDNNSTSNGDMISHIFIGSNLNTSINDIGNYVISKYVGDINGKMYGSVKSYDPVPHNPEDPMIETEVGPISPIYMGIEAGNTIYDRHNTLVNSQLWMAPHVILPKWYDTTIWQDIGLIEPELPYRVIKSAPEYTNRSTWRDVWLEYAINTPKGNNI